MIANRLLASALAAVACLLVSSALDPADAGRRGSHVRAFSGRAFHAPHMHAGRSHRRIGRHFRRGIIVGVPLAYGAYYYADGCEWLRRRAIYTGSGYWWDRYYACVEGYYY
jgi:hypothetical protein